MNKVMEKLGLYGIIPVVKLADSGDAAPLAEALAAGGLPVAEITFRTDAAEESIKRIRAAFPDVITGAGTVINRGQAERALAAGAQFIVSPGLDEETVRFCLERNVPVMPGVATPSEIQRALGMGLEILKFFPAEALGGVGALKAVSAPLPGAKFVPLGGISAGNLNDYLALPSVFACGGTWMVKDDLIQAGKFEEITSLAAEAVSSMLGFELAHVGINSSGAEASLDTAKKFSEVLGVPLKEGGSSNFAGSWIEVTKSGGPGANGHIAVKTNDIRRALFHLENRGFESEHGTARNSPGGGLSAIYLKGEIGGFAIHLLQK